MKSLTLFIIVILFPVSLLSLNNKKYVIGPWSPGGIGANINFVLQHLYYCELHNYNPVVYWGNNSLYYNTQGFNGSNNVWEYYFEPVSSLKYENEDVINSGYLDKDPASYGWLYIDHVNDKSRSIANHLIKKYIKVKQIIREKIDKFYNLNMAGKKTIGIHLRGTDKFQGENVKIDLTAFIIEAIKNSDNDTQFLIATDEKKLLDQAIILLAGKKVIYYDCHRSEDGKPLHAPNRKVSYAQVGEDVVVEMYLLSKCDLLIHSMSSVSSVVLYVNPNLKTIYLKGYIPK